MGRGKGKTGGKRSPDRVKFGAGTMKGHPGHKSKLGKTTLTFARWNQEKERLLNQAMQTMPLKDAIHFTEETMKQKYRLRIVKGKR